jgi:hypothetical protein
MAMTEQTEAARWRGYSHKELYTLLHAGSGPAASAEPSRRWSELSSTLSDVGQDLSQALTRSGAGWSGPAAGAALERLSVLADWAGETGVGAAAMRAAVETQGDHIARARADMPAPEDTPPPQPDPTVAPAVVVIAAQTDPEPVEAAASAGEQRAFEVMVAYERDTNTNTSALAAFATPPELALSTDLHSNGRAGISATTIPAAAGLGWAPPAGPGSGPGPGPGPDHGHRPHGEPGRGGGHHAPITSGAAAEAEVLRRPAPPAPGNFTGAVPVGEPTASVGPFGGSVRRGGGGSARSTGRGLAGSSPSPLGAGGSGGGGGAVGGAAGPGGAHGGATSGFPAGLRPDELPAAAAGQAAATAPGAAGGAAGGGAGSGAQDKTAMRRFGMDTIGSGQWFGDDEQQAQRNTPPRRRRDFREVEQVTESVSIMGEEHKLPPNVIGEGPR